eukprot:6800031-Prorocentrum_lima.AAC.1
MTSSLVGSEMCIRDRDGVAAAYSAITRELETRPNHVLLAMDVSSAFPVSYTHLTLPTICSV